MFVRRLGGPLLPIVHASQSRYAVPAIFMANCNEGAAINSPDRPASAMDASAARPKPTPLINGMERRKPNCAPDVVANVVAPPGVMVDVNANRARGRSESVAMLWPLHAAGHQLRECIRQLFQIVLIVVDMR